MPDDVTDALGRSAFAFVGSVEHLGAATMAGVAIDELTAVVHVDLVLHAPSAFAQLAGSRVTLQSDPQQDPLQAGEQWTFFADGLAFGESVALTEIARLPVRSVEPHLAQAAAEGHADPFRALRVEIADTQLREHAASAEAVVVGRVVRLERATEPRAAEHDPEWWRATIKVHHVESGDVREGELAVLFPNSSDVRWHAAPKPQAGDDGVWILHATEGSRAELAPYQLLHPEDQRPIQRLDALRGEGADR